MNRKRWKSLELSLVGYRCCTLSTEFTAILTLSTLFSSLFSHFGNSTPYNNEVVFLSFVSSVLLLLIESYFMRSMWSEKCLMSSMLNCYLFPSLRYRVGRGTCDMVLHKIRFKVFCSFLIGEYQICKVMQQILFHGTN